MECRHNDVTTVTASSAYSARYSNAVPETMLLVTKLDGDENIKHSSETKNIRLKLPASVAPKPNDNAFNQVTSNNRVVHKQRDC